MTEPLYSDEAIIRSVTYHGKAGHKISLELDPAGWERLKGMETQRCMMVLVPIQNDGQPDPDAAQRAPTPAEKPRRRMAELSRAQQAGILCNESQFQAFIERVYDVVLRNKYNDPATLTAEFVRDFCRVTSRAELDTVSGAGALWDQLRAEFDASIGRIGRPE